MCRQARRIAMAVVLSAACVASGPVFVSAQATDTDIQKVAGLLAGSKYPSTRATGRNPSAAVWHIARRGEQMGSFTIIVTVQDGLLITFVTVAPKANIRRTTELVDKVLGLNLKYDYVKSGFDDDGDAFVRIDARLRLVDVEEMNAIIQQVGNTADAMYTTLKPFLDR